MIRFLVACALLAVPAAGTVPFRRLPPADHCASDRSFAAFRTALRAAVDRRDAAWLLANVTPDIQFSFGDSPGRDGFVRAWGLDHPATSPLWRELGSALRLGCSRDEGGDLWVPSMSLVGDEHMDVDYSTSMVATAPGASLRAGPSEGSALVARLRWDVVELQGRDRGGAWLRATLADGRRGYIRRALFRGFEESRAVFTRRNGRWLMSAFVAGD